MCGESVNGASGDLGEDWGSGNSVIGLSLELPAPPESVSFNFFSDGGASPSSAEIISQCSN